MSNGIAILIAAQFGQNQNQFQNQVPLAIPLDRQES